MATKGSAPTQPSGVIDNSKSFSPASRTALQDSTVQVKGQPSGGGLSSISGDDPTVGTTDPKH